MSPEMIRYILILVLFESIAFYSLSKHHNTRRAKWLFVAMLIYGVVVANMLAKSLDYGSGIGTVNFSWNCCSTVTAFLIGIYLFGEKVNNLQWIGVGLAFTGLVLILFSSQIMKHLKLN
jgi:multidrug transporter EmrE-like cation transporter